MRIESLRDLLGQFPDIDGFWNFDDLPKTEAHIKSFLPASESDSWSPSALEALTQLGRAQSLQGNLSVARLSLDQAQKRISELEGPVRLRPEIRCLLEQGRVLCLQMTPSKAQNYFSQAWTLSTDAKEVFFAIDAALMLSISQPPKFQNEWLQKALVLAEETKTEQGQLWLSQLYTMDGWHKFDFRMFDKALESFEKALARPRFKGDESKNFIIRWCIARTLRALGQNQQALDMQQVLNTELLEVGGSNGHVYLELAECQQALNRPAEAKTNFEYAYKELSANGWYSDNKASELGRIQYLSKKSINY
jgi:tetratricopeptide (TPR) repeat protein